MPKLLYPESFYGGLYPKRMLSNAILHYDSIDKKHLKSYAEKAKKEGVITYYKIVIRNNHKPVSYNNPYDLWGWK